MPGTACFSLVQSKMTVVAFLEELHDIIQIFALGTVRLFGSVAQRNYGHDGLALRDSEQLSQLVCIGNIQIIFKSQGIITLLWDLFRTFVPLIHKLKHQLG
jgi:hypothetical protein